MYFCCGISMYKRHLSNFNLLYFRPIPTKNKGFKLLENMGWTPGKSLGSSNSGIKEPVSIVQCIIILLIFYA